MNHNVTCYGYTLELDRAGKFQLEMALALNIPKQYWNRLQKGETIEEDGKPMSGDGHGSTEKRN